MTFSPEGYLGVLICSISNDIVCFRTFSEINCLIYPCKIWGTLPGDMTLLKIGKTNLNKKIL